MNLWIGRKGGGKAWSSKVLDFRDLAERRASEADLETKGHRPKRDFDWARLQAVTKKPSYVALSLLCLSRLSWYPARTCASQFVSLAALQPVRPGRFPGHVVVCSPVSLCSNLPLDKSVPISLTVGWPCNPALLQDPRASSYRSASQEETPQPIIMPTSRPKPPRQVLLRKDYRPSDWPSCCRAGLFDPVT